MKTNVLQAKKALMVLFAMLVPLLASAQFSATVEQYANDDYSQVGAEFTLTEVANALQTDTATLAAALNAWYNYDAESGAEKPADMFFLKSGDALVADYNTNAPGGFWMTSDYQVAPYGENTVFYEDIWFDSAEDLFGIYLGQYPNALAEGATLTPTFVLAYGDKQATFDITYIVKPMPEMPAVELDITKLEIVGNAEVTTEQYPRINYNSSAVYVNIAGAAEKLGIDNDLLSIVLKNCLYKARVDETYQTKIDSLTLATNNGGWGREVLDMATGDTLPEVCAAPWSDKDQYFMDSWAFNAENDTLTCYIGQYPYNLQAGDKYYTNVYIVYGSKAFVVKYNVNIVEDPIQNTNKNLTSMTKVGSDYIVVEQQPNNDYSTSTIYVNVDSVAELLGCTTGDLILKAIDNNGELSANSTAQNGGYWMTQSGSICVWGSGAYFLVEPSSTSSYAHLRIGQFPTRAIVGEEAHTLLYLVANEKYYEIEIALHIIGPETGKYKITYMLEDRVICKVVVAPGSKIKHPEVPVKKGYTFSGWSEVPEFMPTENITVYGSFIPNKYEVSYILEGEVIKKDSIQYSMKIPRIEAPQIEGYTFIGWEGPVEMPTEDVIITGHYEINKYNLRYVVDGKVFKEDSVTYQATITPESTIPVKEGHTFIGWSNLPATMPASDVEVEALFKVNKYCITYVIDNVVIATEFVEYGADIVLMNPPVKDGYTFAGWSYVPEKMPATDIMVIGVYTTNSYRLIYLVDGEEYNSDIVECGTSIILPQEPAKEGYTFSGWDAVPEVMPAHEVVIKGSFVPNKYLVTFKIDGIIISSESLEYGSSITVPNAPEREGYTFNGWGEVAETVPANDVTYEGSYSVNSYILTFIVDGETVQTGSVQYGSTIVAPEPPVKEGHTFSGWGEVPATMPASDVTIKATFIINKYLVTFEVDGIIVSSKSLEYGSTITVPTMPEREGYTFSGWSNIDATVPANDVTYHATYTPNTYKVYYFVGATLVHIAEVTYGEAIPEYTYKPTTEGDVFMGWIGEAYDTMPAHDVTYTANIVNGIENSEINTQNSAVIYDLTGRKVLDTENLKGGIYIKDGKKVVIK